MKTVLGRCMGDLYDPAPGQTGFLDPLSEQELAKLDDQPSWLQDLWTNAVQGIIDVQAQRKEAGLETWGFELDLPGGRIVIGEGGFKFEKKSTGEEIYIPDEGLPGGITPGTASMMAVLGNPILWMGAGLVAMVLMWVGQRRDKKRR